MRTSGSDSDFMLFVTPVAVLLFLTVLWMGGPTEFIRVLDRSVNQAVTWVASLIR
jgi:hypothetical protein